ARLAPPQRRQSRPCWLPRARVRAGRRWIIAGWPGRSNVTSNDAGAPWPIDRCAPLAILVPCSGSLDLEDFSLVMLIQSVQVHPVLLGVDHRPNEIEQDLAPVLLRRQLVGEELALALVRKSS